MSLDLPDGTPLPPLEAKTAEQVAAEIKDCTYSWTAFLDGWQYHMADGTTVGSITDTGAGFDAYSVLAGDNESLGRFQTRELAKAAVEERVADIQA